MSKNQKLNASKKASSKYAGNARPNHHRINCVSQGGSKRIHHRSKGSKGILFFWGFEHIWAVQHKH